MSVYYVSESTGNDANTGTSKNFPMKTIKSVLLIAKRNDAIHFLDSIIYVE